MPFCGGFLHFYEVSGTKQCTQAHAETCESVAATLLAVDNAERAPNH
jgi:hypothetical protein